MLSLMTKFSANFKDKTSQQGITKADYKSARLYFTLNDQLYMWL